VLRNTERGGVNQYLELSIDFLFSFSENLRLLCRDQLLYILTKTRVHPEILL
jgi:hypothetical protein